MDSRRTPVNAEVEDFQVPAAEHVKWHQFNFLFCFFAQKLDILISAVIFGLNDKVQSCKATTSYTLMKLNWGKICNYFCKCHRLQFQLVLYVMAFAVMSVIRSVGTVQRWIEVVLVNFILFVWSCFILVTSLSARRVLQLVVIFICFWLNKKDLNSFCDVVRHE